MEKWNFHEGFGERRVKYVLADAFMEWEKPERNKRIAGVIESQNPEFDKEPKAIDILDTWARIGDLSYAFWRWGKGLFNGRSRAHSLGCLVCLFVWIDGMSVWFLRVSSESVFSWRYNIEFLGHLLLFDQNINHPVKLLFISSCGPVQGDSLVSLSYSNLALTFEYWEAVSKDSTQDRMSEAFLFFLSFFNRQIRISVLE